MNIHNDDVWVWQYKILLENLYSLHEVGRILEDIK